MAKIVTDVGSHGSSIAWRAGDSSAPSRPADGKEDEGRPSSDRFKQSGRDEIKSLAKAEASVVESERRVARQMALIKELRADGLATLEAERSLTRLEAAVIEQRALRDVVLVKAREVGGKG